MYRSLSSQKRESDPMELELQVVASCYEGARNRKWMHPLREQNVLTAVSSLQLLGTVFHVYDVYMYGCTCVWVPLY